MQVNCLPGFLDSFFAGAILENILSVYFLLEILKAK